MKVLFMGTPQFAVPSLQALLDSRHQVVAAVSQPDKPSGRGLATRPTPVKAAAEAAGIPVLQPPSVKKPPFLDEIRQYAPDLIAVVAFGRILPQAILELPRLGAVNVHSSLLPRYRGAAPAAWAIARGEEVTGVTTMKMVEALDAGDILLQRSTKIGEEETTADLEPRLAEMGAKLLVETLDALAQGTIASIPQDEDKATYAPIINKQDGLVDWTSNAEVISRHARAFIPWPVAYSFSRGKRFRIWEARPATAVTVPASATPGTVLQADKNGVVAACGDGTALELIEIQPDGKKRMPAPAAVAGRFMAPGDQLGGR